MTIVDSILDRIETKRTTVGVIGLGYVARPPSSLTAICLAVGRGFPLTLYFVEKGFRTIGFDPSLRSGQALISLKLTQ